MADDFTPEGLVKDFISPSNPTNGIEKIIGNFTGEGNTGTPANSLEQIVYDMQAGETSVTPGNGLEKRLKKYLEEGGGQAVLVDKTFTENGEYDPTEYEADGFGVVTVAVPNTYEESDEGKVVSSGELVAQTSETYTSNGTYNTTTVGSVTVGVPNTYTQSDEGKVVSGGELVAQSSQVYNANGTYNTTTVNSVVVNVPTSGDMPNKIVEFRDYDGTLLHTYTAAEFAELSALPVAPTHAGLVSQGWNWTLANAKDYVANVGSLIISHNYLTDDNKTRIYFTTPDEALPEGSQFNLNLILKGDYTLDYGDGSPVVTGNYADWTWVSFDHDWAPASSFVISVHASQGLYLYGSYDNSLTNIGPSVIFTLNGSAHTMARNMITKVEFGTPAWAYYGAFADCTNLETVCGTKWISFAYHKTYYNCTKLKYIGLGYDDTEGGGFMSLYNNAFEGCTALEHISLPNGVDLAGAYLFKGCRNLKEISIPSGVQHIYNYDFQNCISLEYAYIGAGPTDIGTSAFTGCENLKAISIPSTVTRIGSSAFSGCSSLKSVTVPDTVTYIGSNVFGNCYALYSAKVPDNLTDTSNAYVSVFAGCSALRTVNTPTCLTKLAGSDYSGCYNLWEATIPSGVTEIGSNAFKDCKSMKRLRFEPTTPPSARYSNWYSGLSTSCIIEVPAGNRSAYISASNYPPSNTYTYVEYSTT